MQTFENYLKDIHASDYMGTDDDMTDKFDSWLENQDIDTLMSYADDYAKDCIRIDHERILEGINQKQLENYRELGTNKHDWCYEECMEVVKDLK